jgi:hypothetical protein
MQEAVFKGASGKLYRFSALRPDAPAPAGPAVYVFARPAVGGRNFTALFLSRTADLSLRMQGHERWEEARLLGATHLLVGAFSERSERALAEADLAEGLRPIMNEAPPAEIEDEPAPMGQVLRFFPPIAVRAAATCS